MTEGDGLTLEKTMTLGRNVHKQSKKLSIPQSKSEKGNSDQKCFACDKTRHFPGAPNARPRTLPVDSARRKGTLTQSAERNLHKS